MIKIVQAALFGVVVVLLGTCVSALVYLVTHADPLVRAAVSPISFFLWVTIGLAVIGAHTIIMWIVGLMRRGHPR